MQVLLYVLGGLWELLINNRYTPKTTDFHHLISTLSKQKNTNHIVAIKIVKTTQFIIYCIKKKTYFEKRQHFNRIEVCYRGGAKTS